MIQTEVGKGRSRRLSTVFNRLCEQDQTYLETLTAQLAEIHETSPERRFSTGKTSEDIVQQNKAQEP